MDSSGNFVVVWSGFSQIGDLDAKIFGQRFDGSGKRVGSEFLVNAYTTNRQTNGSVALNSAGNFVVAWDSYLQDGSKYGVFARRAEFSAARGLAVDAHSGSVTSGNLNGVLESGETALVETSWRNTTGGTQALSGAASELGGPAGPSYSLAQNVADYGSVADGATSSCFDATGDCYRVSVTGQRPLTHWDAQFSEALNISLRKGWTLHVGGSFGDVPTTHPFYAKIETLLHNGITGGCTTTTYCPGDSVSRAQMAIFIAKAIAGNAVFVPVAGQVGSSAYNCTAGGVSLFTDVSPTDIFCKHVHYIAAQNVTLGCSTGKYCPGDTVTRLQMAGFMAKAIVAPDGGAGIPDTYGPDPVTGLSYSCYPAVTFETHFTDVSATDQFCKHVHYLWAKGIIAGCGGTLYCPTNPVTRDAMAKFLVNAFSLSLYGP